MGTKLCVAIVMIALVARRDVLAEGVSCGLRRIERIMRANALRARPQGGGGLPKDEGERAAASPDLLERRFAADAPNRKWIADFASIWTAEGWLDVAAFIDLFSRRVVGWSMQASMTAQRVTDALVMAIWRRGKPDALLHHSDQGSHYTSEACQRLMAEHGVTCSMKRAFHSTSFTSRRCRASLRSRVPSDVKIMLRPMAATQSLGTRRR
ncbi:transposase InsO family protein [Methylorubrum zatmanii]|nr:transposase InsO family protein [Methylorubrum zatmanii]MCP1553721.1 transposase InsO family protein [Methylorubrum extorquens]MCP1579967.1 transposase InsO family protein [Methylorubrum extorquens]